MVGGGVVAQRKIETLLEYGAAIHMISRELTTALRKYVEDGKIKHLAREFTEDSLKGAFLVIAATDDPILNHHVSEDAKRRGLLINAVDQPSDCNFIVPSILRRGDFLISVSTSGKSPALSKKVREELEKGFGSEYGYFLILMGHLRKEILGKGLSGDENRRIFHELVHSIILDAMGRRDWSEVAIIINKILQTHFSQEDIINLLDVPSIE